MSQRWFLSGRNSYSKLFSPQTLPCFVITYCVTSSLGYCQTCAVPRQLNIGLKRILIFPYLYKYTCVYVQGSVDEWLCVLVTAIFVYLFLLSPFGLCGVVLGMSASWHVLGTTERALLLIRLCTPSLELS